MGSHSATSDPLVAQFFQAEDYNDYNDNNGIEMANRSSQDDALRINSNGSADHLALTTTTP